MTRLAVSCLGSGAALSQGRLWSCLLVNERLLLSLPPSAVPELYRQGHDPASLEAIFISHLHADHFFGLPFLLLPYRLGLLTRTAALEIVGPSGIADATFEICRIAWPGIHTSSCLEGLPVRFTEIEGEGEGKVGSFAFEAVRTRHFEMVSYGYKIHFEGRTIGYTGDTGECDGLARLAEGVDLLIAEFTHTDPEGFCTDGHLGVPAIRRLADRLRERGVPLLATHLAGEPPSIDGVTVVEDGGEYVV
jgi:ribonuclease BN (tRNA processing enzyme)